MHDSVAILTRFNRLMRDLERGESSRNTFEAWEIELLLDFEACTLDAPVQRKLLDRYRRAVERGLAAGERTPRKFSEYLSTKAGAPDAGAPDAGAETEADGAGALRARDARGPRRVMRDA